MTARWLIEQEIETIEAELQASLAEGSVYRILRLGRRLADLEAELEREWAFTV